MKRTKTAKRIVSGLLGAVILTSFILVAVDAYHAGREFSYSAAAAESEPADTSAGSTVSGSGPDLTNRNFLHAVDADLSIGASERQMLYQSQDAEGFRTVLPDTGNSNGNTTLQAGADNYAPSNNQTQSQSDGTAEQTYTEMEHTEEADAENNGTEKEDVECKDTQKTDTGNKDIGKTDLENKDIGKTDLENKNIRKTDPENKDIGKTDAEDKDIEKTNPKHKDIEKTDPKHKDIKKTDPKHKDTEKTDTENEKKNKPASENSGKTFQTVTEEYFSDALFIGDSRTVGMFQSHLLPQAAYYAKTGIGIGDILTERIVNEGGVMISVTEALRRHSFGKVYIMIGINDIARGDVEWFTEQYKKILATVRQTQPDAVIYIQGNIPMSYRTQDLDGALNNRNLSQRDKASRELADSEHIFYLDISSIYADANGHLASAYTRDGLHVCTDDYPLWVDYLLQHAVVCT